MGLPIHVYPLYEHGRQAHKRQTAQQNAQESGSMYAAFDEIGSKNEYSWNYKESPKSAEYIATVAKRNRMICDPCEKTKGHRCRQALTNRRPFTYECVQCCQPICRMYTYVDGQCRKIRYP